MTQADSQLARLHGVSPQVVVAIREQQLQEGVHFTLRGSRLTYTAAGVHAVEEELQRAASAEITLPGQGFTLWLPTRKKEGADEPPPAPKKEEPADVTTARVTRLMPNKTWIRVAFADGRTEPCRVRNHARLRIGHMIEVGLVGDQWQATQPALAPR